MTQFAIWPTLENGKKYLVKGFIIMMNLEVATSWITLLTFTIAYCASVSTVGAFSAWITKKMGDDTASVLGFLSLNPLVHIDPVGFVFLCLFSFGWGKRIPINPFNITGPYRLLKLVGAYLAESIAYFTSALIGMIILIASFGLPVLLCAQQMLASVYNMSHLYLVNTCPALSSFEVVIAFILIAFISLNLILGVLNLLFNGVNVLMYYIIEMVPEWDEYRYYISLFAHIVLILLFSQDMRLFAIRFISLIGYLIAQTLYLV